MAGATFAAVFAALFAAHMVADHWIQTDHQARHKALPGWAGWRHNLAHVATYTATAAVALVLVAWRTGLPVHLGQAAAGLAVSAVTHAWADRRAPLRRLAERTGHATFVTLAGNGLNGAYLLDQSWHIGWLFVAALVIGGGA